jgi:hypothetical protein
MLRADSGNAAHALAGLELIFGGQISRTARLRPKMATDRKASREIAPSADNHCLNC